MYYLLYLLVSLRLAAAVPMQHPPAAAWVQDKCGYDSCIDAKTDFLNVHIVAHTHDDVGWLKTVDQYYYGVKNYIQKAGVQYIIDSVVKELLENEKRKFIYVETAFFWKWWVRQTPDSQELVKMLVREGRLQFVGGAWSMNDEAAAHYHSIIDQFTHGLRKLNSTFGPCGIPTVGWQIDPFGHSREFASLLAAMGYDGLFLGRIDYQDKSERMEQVSMEMVWRGDDDLGNSSDIFTSVLYNQYQPPPGFCFDVLCADEPIVDDPDSPEFNVDKKVSKFLVWAQKQAKRYATNNVLVTMGGDFTYQDAGMWYKNLDKLIQYTNLMAAKDGLDVNVFYSTPTCYLKSVRIAQPILPIKQDDFFPYASDPTAYWTGYFTSRPTTKYFERRGNAQLQMIKQIQVLANMEKHYEFIIDELRATMGVMQHHDAITGTEKQHVTHDYVKMLNSVIEDSLILVNQAYNKISQGDITKLPVLSFKRCALNESRCEVIEDINQFAINVYNPLPWSRTYVLRVPVTEQGPYDIRDPTGEKIQSAIQPIFKVFLNKFQTSARYELIFLAKLQPLGFITYYVSHNKRSKRDANKTRKYDYNENITDYGKVMGAQPVIEYANVEEKLDGKNGNDEKRVFSRRINDDVVKGRADNIVLGLEKIGVTKVKTEKSNVGKPREPHLTMMNAEEMRMLSDDPATSSVTMVVERFEENDEKPLKPHRSKADALGQITHNQNHYSLTHRAKYYPACAGNNHEYKNRSSGAYIFRPNATKAYDLRLIETSSVENFIGKEYYNVLSNNVSYILRINNPKYIPYNELEWIVGSINVDDNIGKEFVLTHTINEVRNNGVFFTDSNGRQMIKRIKDRRPLWNVTLAEPVAGNYYPINNEITLENDDVRLIVLTDRSCGGTSLNQGEIEIMVHRRLLYDDAFGVGEALNEVENGTGLIVRGTHKFLVTPTKYTKVEDAVATRRIEIEAQYEPIVLFADASELDYSKWMKMKNIFTGINSLDMGVNVLTLEPWEDGTLLLRLENILSSESGLKASDLDRNVNIAKIFKHIRVISVRETLLAANQWVNEHQHWHWKTDREFNRNFNDYYGNEDKVSSSTSGNVNEAHDNGLVITIRPKQIRTFVVKYEYIDQ